MDKLAALFSIPMHKLSEMFSILMLNLSKLLQFAQPKSGHQKIKGFVVLQKKNVLDFNDFFAGIGDNLGELVGKAVSFQLVSTSQIDSSDGMGKLSNIALLQKWIFSPQGVVAGQTNHGIEFDWDSNLGPPGAFFITNSHAAASPYKNTTTYPVGLGEGFHCSDLLLKSAQSDPSVAAVQAQGLAAMKQWLSAFQPKVHRRDAVEKTSTFVKPVNAWAKSFGSA